MEDSKKNEKINYPKLQQDLETETQVLRPYMIEKNFNFLFQT